MAKGGNSVKTYRLGRRFRIYRNIGYILCTCVVVAFFFIYDYLLRPSGLIPTNLLAVIFVVIEAAFMAAIHKGSQWLEKVYYYELDAKGLTIVTNKNRKVYTWDKFQSVELGMFTMVDLCPVRYYYEGSKVMFSQYLDRDWEMHLEIFRRIGDHVTISPDLIKQVEAMSR